MTESPATNPKAQRRAKRRAPQPSHAVMLSQGLRLSCDTPGLPERFPTVLTYTSNQILNSVLGVISTWTFATNGMYDPDITYTGHQPQLFDQFSTLYSNYCVYKTELEFTVVPNGASDSAAMVAYYPSNTNTSGTLTIQEAAEQKDAKMAFLVGKQKISVLRSSDDIAYILGKSTQTVLDDANYSPVTGANPPDVVYGLFNYGTLDGTNGSVYVQCKLRFHCVFTQLKQFTSS